AVQQRARRQPGFVDHAPGRGRAPRLQVRDRHAGIEYGGEGGRGQLLGEHPGPALDGDRPAIDGQRTDRTDSAAGIEELAGRVDLERAYRQRQRVVARLPAWVGEPVARDQARTRRFAVRERGDVELQVVARPVHGRDGQVALLQRLPRAHVVPGGQGAIDQHEGFDAETAARDLDRAVLADQSLLAAAIQAEDGPVGLLTAEAARVQPL